MSLDVRISGFRRDGDCQLSGKSSCDCFVVAMPGTSGPLTVSPAALATWVKNKADALSKQQGSRDKSVEAPRPATRSSEA
jgi:hypothetical protein